MTRLTGFFERIGAGNFAWVSSGQVAYAITQAGVLSVLARLGGADVVGQFALALAVVTPVFQLTRFRLRDVVATDVTNEHLLTDYLRVAILSALAGLVISVVTGLVLGMSATVLTVIVLMSLARGTEGLSHISYGYQQRNGVMAPVGKSLIIRGVADVILLGVAYAVTGQVAWAAVGILIAHLLVFFGYDLARVSADLNAHWKSSPISYREIRGLVFAAAPLGLFSFLVAVGDNVPRIALNSYGDLAAVGIFSAFGFMVAGASAITRSLAQVSSPKLARAISELNPSKLRRQLLALSGLGTGIGFTGMIGAALIGDWFLGVFFGPDFAAHSFEFFLMAIVGWAHFVASPLSMGLIAARKYVWLTVIQLAVVGTIWFVATLVIPDLGIRGAVYALLIGGFLRVVATAVALWRLGAGMQAARVLTRV